MPKSKQTKKARLHLAMIKQMITLVTGGFGLVAALAWNSVIQEFVNEYIKKYLAVGSGTISLLIYAIVITVLVVFVSFQLAKIQEKLEEKE